MKKTIKQKPQEEESIDILKRIAKRVEEATIDISDIKHNLQMVSLRLNNVEHNTKMTKADVEKMKNNIDELIEMNAEILAKMVTQEELETVSERVDKLEHAHQSA